MHYELIKDNDIFEIAFMQLDANGYQVKSRADIIKNINFYNEEMLSNFITNKFASKIKKITQIILNMIFSDDADEGDFLLALDDLDRLKTLAELNYKKHMKIENYKKYVDQIYYLEGLTNQKLAVVNFENNYEESYGSRRM